MQGDNQAVYDPRTHTAEGKKLDSGKAPILQGFLAYFPKAIEAVANVSRYGSIKYQVPYADKNWRRVPDATARYADALARHVVSEGTDGLVDPESHLLHAAHAAWNSLARLELLLTPDPLAKQQIQAVNTSQNRF